MFAARRQAAVDSPSIPLEKGQPRLRPPVTLKRRAPPSPSPRRRRPRTPTTPTARAVETTRKSTVLRTVGVVTFLTVVILLALLVYLWRWAHWSSRIPPSQGSEFERNGPAITTNKEQLSRFFTTHHESVPHAPQSYLMWNLHSGFHNQRISFENAMVLAHLLNRTLIVFPIRLGIPLNYETFDELHRNLALSGKHGLEHCRMYETASMSLTPRECLGYNDYTLLPWSAVVNLTALAHLNPIIERWDSSSAWLHRYLDISEAQTAYIKEASRYEYRIYDERNDTQLPGPRYDQQLYIDDLREKYASIKMLEFGTLFGTTRLRLTLPEHLQLRRQIREGMVLSNPLLLQISRGIATELHKITSGLDAEHGGGYFGVHLRLGDGAFEENTAQNVRLVWWKLMTLVMGLSDHEAAGLEGVALGSYGTFSNYSPPSPPPGLEIDRTPLAYPHPPLPPYNPNSHVQHKCQMKSIALNVSLPLLSVLHAPVFIATDARNPTSHPSLQLFTRTLPCVFFLSDPLFAPHLVPFNSPSLINDDDGVHLAKFLFPFLDAMIAAMGRDVVGTPHSTFSSFTRDVLYRAYKGWQIVERGT